MLIERSIVRASEPRRSEIQTRPEHGERPRSVEPAADQHVNDERDIDEHAHLIGPNAVLQLVAAMRDHLGMEKTQAILEDAQIEALPSGSDMIPEIEAMRLHRWLFLHEPDGSYAIERDAGRRTADYIIAHRIPRFAVWLLPHLPAALAARILMRAINKHAWTFIGAGQFRPEGPWQFAINRRNADDAIMPPDTVFEWYGAVFERLYQRLICPGTHCHDDGDGRDVMVHHYSLRRMT